MTSALRSSWNNVRLTSNLQLSSMAAAGDTQLFEESVSITTLDHAKYDRVARIGATSSDGTVVMTLDINTELYPCAVGETLHVVLATSLSMDGSKDDSRGWRDVARQGLGGEATLADMYDYVCHGKIYKFEDSDESGKEEFIKVYISFGGLLMAIEGPYKKLTSLRVDYIYLLLKKD
ncbi:hypothetical protein B7494_g6227 [Chlorociboria aeruginascens]|nr:hypothetical protein B7494_g6227 [Chlorociboria aeruginascens]